MKTLQVSLVELKIFILEYIVAEKRSIKKFGESSTIMKKFRIKKKQEWTKTNTLHFKNELLTTSNC